MGVRGLMYKCMVGRKRKSEWKAKKHKSKGGKDLPSSQRNNFFRFERHLRCSEITTRKKNLFWHRCVQLVDEAFVHCSVGVCVKFSSFETRQAFLWNPTWEIPFSHPHICCDFIPRIQIQTFPGRTFQLLKNLSLSLFRYKRAKNQLIQAPLPHLTKNFLSDVSCMEMALFHLLVVSNNIPGFVEWLAIRR